MSIYYKNMLKLTDHTSIITPTYIGLYILHLLHINQSIIELFFSYFSRTQMFKFNEDILIIYFQITVRGTFIV